VTGDWDEGRAKDWGASEIHDWGAGSTPSTVPEWADATGTETAAPVDVGGRRHEADAGGEAEGDEDDDPVASYVELAMENLQRSPVRADTEEEAPLYCFGSGDTALYALDDGPGRLMIGRAVGQDDDNCVYCLVGATSSSLLDALDGGEVRLTEAFDDAGDLTLCSVFEADEVDNVVLVQHYEGIEDVPDEYRPGRPFLQFTDD
jgi:hypothetical protein